MKQSNARVSGRLAADSKHGVRQQRKPCHRSSDLFLVRPSHCYSTNAATTGWCVIYTHLNDLIKLKLNFNSNSCCSAIRISHKWNIHSLSGVLFLNITLAVLLRRLGTVTYVTVVEFWVLVFFLFYFTYFLLYFFYIFPIYNVQSKLQRSDVVCELLFLLSYSTGRTYVMLSATCWR